MRISGDVQCFFLFATVVFFKEQYEFLHRCLAVTLTSEDSLVSKNSLLSEPPLVQADFEKMFTVSKNVTVIFIPHRDTKM